MSTDILATYLIPDSRVEGLQKLFTKLARKIEKGKTAADYAPTLEVVHTVMMANNKPFNPDTVYPKKTQFIPHSWVTIKYQQPALNGWFLMAVYDWEVTPDGERTCYVSTVPGQITPMEYREIEDGRCDHCNTNRRRKKSMLITKDFLTYQVVGTSCIKDFLGHHSPETLMDMYKWESSIRDYMGEVSGDLATSAYYNVKDVLTIAAMLVRRYGYVKTNDYAKKPTAWETGTIIDIDYGHSPLLPEDKEWYENHKPVEQDTTTAEHAIKWVKEQPDFNDYIANLQKCVAAGAISHKRFGILVSLIQAYSKAREKRVEANNTRTNEWIGDVKERLKGFTATVKRTRLTDGYYGAVTVVTLETASGDTLVWFATGSHTDIEPHDTWVFDGTVKKHDEFNGTKQTVITRVKYTLQHQEQAA